MADPNDFPVITRDPERIPKVLADLVYSQYKREFSNGQSLERLRARGGFGVYEIAWLLSRRIAHLESVLQKHQISYERDQ